MSNRLADRLDLALCWVDGPADHTVSKALWLANLIPVPEQTVRAWLSGVSEPSLPALRLIAGALDVEVDWLISGNPNSIVRAEPQEGVLVYGVDRQGALLARLAADRQRSLVPA